VHFLCDFMDIKALSEFGGFADLLGTLSLRVVTSQELMMLIGSATGFRFARQFIETPCLWYNCPVSKNNLITDFLSSVTDREKTFRGITIKTGEVSNAKFLLVQKDGLPQLFVSNEETRNYVFSLQDLGINPLQCF